MENLKKRLAEVEQAHRELQAVQAENNRILQAMGVINKIITRATNPGDMLDEVLAEYLDIFSCDRAWLLYPCDPDAETWHVPKERTRPEWPGALSEDVHVPMDDFSKKVFTTALETDGVVRFDLEVNPFFEFEGVQKKFNILSQLVIAIHPTIGKPWLVGIHHCREKTLYSKFDCNLFKILSDRINDGLSRLLQMENTLDMERRLNAELENRVIERTRELIETRDDLNRAQKIANIGSWVWEIETGAETWSDQQFVIFGYEPGEVEPAIELFEKALHPDDKAHVFEAVTATLERNEPFSVEFRIITKNGDTRLIHSHGEVERDENNTPIRMIGTVHDITEAREMESALAQTSKLATLGEMATGMAHELNQPLNVIKMATHNINSKLAKNKVSAEHIKEKVDKIEAMVDRASSIINHMRIFGRSSHGDAEAICPRRVINAALDLISHQMRLSNIEVALDFEKTNACFIGHQIQFEQVFLNLLNNARDAMESAPDGEKYMKVKSCLIDDGANIQIDFEDSGGGIPEDALPNIFNPFFTTKDVGKGTGLGLSISYGIVSEAGGTISAENTEKGARFRITLPVAPATDAT